MTEILLGIVIVVQAIMLGILIVVATSTKSLREATVALHHTVKELVTAVQAKP